MVFSTKGHTAKKEIPAWDLQFALAIRKDSHGFRRSCPPCCHDRRWRSGGLLRRNRHPPGRYRQAILQLSPCSTACRVPLLLSVWQLGRIVSATGLPSPPATRTPPPQAGQRRPCHLHLLLHHLLAPYLPLQAPRPEVLP